MTKNSKARRKKNIRRKNRKKLNRKAAQHEGTNSEPGEGLENQDTYPVGGIVSVPARKNLGTSVVDGDSLRPKQVRR